MERNSKWERRGFYGTGDSKTSIASMLERAFVRMVRLHQQNLRTHPDRRLTASTSDLIRHLAWRMGHPQAETATPTVEMFDRFKSITDDEGMDYRDLSIEVRVLVHLAERAIGIRPTARIKPLTEKEI